MSFEFTEYYECECRSPQHTLKFSLDQEDGHACMYTYVFLDFCQPWYKRIWTAIKYVFGYKSKYGHFDCFSFKPEDVEKLGNLVKTYYRIQK